MLDFTEDRGYMPTLLRLTIIATLMFIIAMEMQMHPQTLRHNFKDDSSCVDMLNNHHLWFIQHDEEE